MSFNAMELSFLSKLAFAVHRKRPDLLALGLQARAQHRLQEFEHDQHDESCAERQSKVIGVQGPEREELTCKRPQKGEGEDSSNDGEHRYKGSVWPPQRC